MPNHDKPLVWVTIPTWNRCNDLKECINSVKEQTYPTIKIVVIDNGSDDDTTNMLHNNFSNIDLITLNHNQGASFASNQGFKFALKNEADFIFRLDSDTVLDKDYIKKLVEFMINNPEVGITSGYIYSFYNPRNIWFTGGILTKWNLGAKYINKLKNFDVNNNKPTQVQLLPSTGMLISRKTLEKISGFDEDYLVYYEDFDFCIRAVKSNIKLFLIPDAKMWHKVFSQKKTSWVANQWNKSKMIFYRKHAYNNLHRLFMIGYAFCYALFRAIFLSEENGNRGPITATLRGLISGLFTSLS